MIISEQDFLDIPFKNISNHKINDTDYLLIGEYSQEKGIKQNPDLHLEVKVHYQDKLQNVWIWE